jgi:trimeric autotransporter adhesin
MLQRFFSYDRLELGMRIDLRSRLSFKTLAAAGALVFFGAAGGHAQTVSPGGTTPAASAENTAQSEVAVGTGSQATFVGSTATGSGANASNQNATATGFSSTAAGTNSTATGWTTAAFGLNATAPARGP